jgi:predicted ATPase
VIIEQPELHLHPRAQARLTDMFVDEIYRIDPVQVDNEGKPTLDYRKHSEVRFLLETHSEHLLLRLQKRVTETAVGINDLQIQGKNRYLVLKDLSIYFVKREAGASSVESITLNEYGEFTKFPDEFETFFADDLIEAGELAKLRLKARAKRRQAIDNSSS